jgi:hypothetical protein
MIPSMARTSRELFAEDNVPVLRFEESDDFQAVRGSSNGHGRGEDFDAVSSGDDPFTELKQKQESLLRIRQELERTQRETEELELRKNKEDRFTNGRREICERLARSLSKLDRELYNSQKAIEEISAARDSFQRHLDELRDIHPESWNRGALEEELDRSIGAVEDAEDDYAKAIRRLATVMPMREEGGAFGALANGMLPADFKGWMLLGFAFSLPLIIAALVVVMLIKFLP